MWTVCGIRPEPRQQGDSLCPSVESNLSLTEGQHSQCSSELHSWRSKPEDVLQPCSCMSAGLQLKGERRKKKLCHARNGRWSHLLHCVVRELQCYATPSCLSTANTPQLCQTLDPNTSSNECSSKYFLVKILKIICHYVSPKGKKHHPIIKSLLDLCFWVSPPAAHPL